MSSGFGVQCLKTKFNTKVVINLNANNTIRPEQILLELKINGTLNEKEWNNLKTRN